MRDRAARDRLRIGLFYKHYEAGGGFPRDWRRFAWELAELGEAVTIYTYEDTTRSDDHPNITVKRYAGNPELSFRLPPGLTQALMEDRAKLDILEIVGAYFPENASVARIARRAGIPYVFALLGQLAPNVVARHPLKKRLFIAAVLERAIRGAVGMHLFSRLEEAWMKKYVDHPTFRTSLGAFVEDLPARRDPHYLRRTLGLPDDAIVLLYLGRLDIAGKGLDTLIAAMSRIRDAVPATTLVLIGPDEGRGRRALETQVRQVGLGGRVFVLDPLFGPEKYSALASADLFVYPSNYDIIPRAVREALSAGCPVLASEETQFEDILTSYAAGLVVPVRADALAAGIVRLVSDRAALVAMRPRARKAAEEALDWRAQALLLRDGYRRLLRLRREAMHGGARDTRQAVR